MLWWRTSSMNTVHKKIWKRYTESGLGPPRTCIDSEASLLGSNAIGKATRQYIVSAKQHNSCSPIALPFPCPPNKTTYGEDSCIFVCDGGDLFRLLSQGGRGALSLHSLPLFRRNEGDTFPSPPSRSFHDKGRYCGWLVKVSHSACLQYARGDSF